MLYEKIAFLKGCGLWKIMALFAFFLLSGILWPGFPLAQNAATAKQNIFKTSARALDSRTLSSGDRIIYLWGVDTIKDAGVSFNLKARIALDDRIAGKDILCDMKSRDAQNRFQAQCIDKEGVDLALYMLQHGFVIVDRTLVYNSVFEDPYLEAEKKAQADKLGVWSDSETGAKAGFSGIGLYMNILLLSSFLLLIGFAGLSFVLLRNFNRVASAQRETNDIMAKDRKLRERERYIIASLIDSEIKANKSKIEAYLSIYKEMLKTLKTEHITPKYKMAGDMVQESPQLNRSAFDHNTNKLDILGPRLSSDLVHFYARIKTSPDYITLEPGMPVEEAVTTVEKALENARQLDNKAEDLIDTIEKLGLLNVQNP